MKYRSKKVQYSPGTYGCHEALHMANYFAEAVEAQLAYHPAVILKPKWRKLADEAAEKLQQLYQEIGAEHL